MLCMIIQLVHMPMVVAPNTAWMNDCNDHGEFDPRQRHAPAMMHGSPSDVSDFKDPSCATRVCPPGAAWWDMPSSETSSHSMKGAVVQAHATDRRRVSVFPGLSGHACDRLSCPNNCGGHGRCVSIASMRFSRRRGCWSSYTLHR